MYVFSINSSCSNGNVFVLFFFFWGGGGGGGERHIINYCRPYLRSDLLTEKRGLIEKSGFSLKMWLANITYTVGKILNFFKVTADLNPLNSR